MNLSHEWGRFKTVEVPALSKLYFDIYNIKWLFYIKNQDSKYHKNRATKYTLNKTKCGKMAWS